MLPNQILLKKKLVIVEENYEQAKKELNDMLKD